MNANRTILVAWLVVLFAVLAVRIGTDWPRSQGGHAARHMGVTGIIKTAAEGGFYLAWAWLLAQLGPVKTLMRQLDRSPPWLSRRRSAARPASPIHQRSRGHVRRSDLRLLQGREAPPIPTHVERWLRQMRERPAYVEAIVNFPYDGELWAAVQAAPHGGGFRASLSTAA